MRLLSVLPLIFGAGIAISQANALPLNVVEPMNGFIRVGHAAAHNGAVAPVPTVKTMNTPTVETMNTTTKVHMRPKHGCAGSLRNKVKKLSDWFRLTFHLRPSTSSITVIMPLKPTGQHRNISQTLAVETQGKVEGHKHHTFASEHPHKFVQRLTHALMMLGPWEGRAVAFILGCGIGVLIRMVWVFAVLAIRSIRGKKQQREEFNEDEVLFEEEEHLLPPPQYAEQAQKLEKKEKESSNA